MEHIKNIWQEVLSVVIESKVRTKFSYHSCGDDRAFMLGNIFEAEGIQYGRTIIRLRCVDRFDLCPQSYSGVCAAARTNVAIETNDDADVALCLDVCNAFSRSAT